MKPVELKKKPICLFLYRVARNISTMEHIFQEHMLPTARQGASYFLSRDRQTVRGMVTETLETPDEVTPHTSKNGFKEDVPHTSRSPWHNESGLLLCNSYRIYSE